MKNFVDLETAVKKLVQTHGGVRSAARVLGINYAYLSRLQSGQKSNPTPEVLRKLGLRRVVFYERMS
jgi:Helix-turn-helix.